MDAHRSEQRKYERAVGRSLVQFHGKNFQIYSNLSDIGEGGLFLRTYYMLDAGDEIDLNFELGELGKTMSAKGKVVRRVEEPSSSDQKGAGLGVAFERIDEDTKQAIKQYIRTTGKI